MVGQLLEYKRQAGYANISKLLDIEIQEDFIRTDLETGSVWDGINGLATDGPHLGKTLERVKSTASFWFGWKDFHPDTVIYGLE